MPSAEDTTKGESDSAIGVERPLWLGLVGAVVGGVVGYFAFYALLNYGSLYALVLPGGLIGLGRAVGSKLKSIPLGIACGILALALSLFIEWQVTPRAGGQAVADFLLHLHEKPFRNIVSILAGPLMAVWFGVGRNVAEEGGE